MTEIRIDGLLAFMFRPRQRGGASGFQIPCNEVGSLVVDRRHRQVGWSSIARGKGQRQSFESCSHGAGRAMSRAEARKRFSLVRRQAPTAIGRNSDAAIPE
jgi:hypothetical protein